MPYLSAAKLSIRGLRLGFDPTMRDELYGVSLSSTQTDN
jgi:hypothetical protein